MVIWRGWGIVALFVILIPLSLGFGVVGSSQGLLVGGIVAGVLMLAGGVGLWFLGTWLNHTRPQQKIDAHLEERAALYEQSFREGRFQAAPGMAVTTDAAVAKSQADSMLEAERAALRAKVPINHSMFWIPLQWWSVIAGIIGIVSVIGGTVAANGS